MPKGETKMKTKGQDQKHVGKKVGEGAMVWRTPAKVIDPLREVRDPLREVWRTPAKVPRASSRSAKKASWSTWEFGSGFRSRVRIGVRGGG